MVQSIRILIFSLTLLGVGLWLNGVAQQTLTVCPHCYHSLQQAIQEANPGDVIIIEPGRYEEDIVIVGKDLTLQGAGVEKVILIGSIEIHDASVAISGITIEGGIRSHTIERSQQELTVEDCVIRNASHGLTIAGNTEALIRDNRIVSNDIGMELKEGTDSIIIGNDISHNTSFGVLKWFLAQAHLLENSIRENGDDGLVILGAAFVERNVIRDNGDCGVWGVLSKSGAHVEGKDNEIANNKGGDLCPPDYPWPEGFKK